MTKQVKNFFVFLILASLIFSLIPISEVAGINSASYEVNPNVVTFFGNFTIRFTTGSAIPGGGWIKISFPNEFELPCNCGGNAWSRSDFLINGVNPSYDPDGNNGLNLKYVNITLPSNMNIAQGSTVVIQIKETARIKNPDKPGTYSLRISTSAEPTEVATIPFEIGYSSVSNVTLAVLTNTILSKTALTIGFKTGLLGDLLPDDYIYVVFDDAFSLPDNIGASYIKVNGYKPVEARVKGHILMFTTPKGVKISKLTQVVVEIDQSAGIVNPKSPGFYGIYVYTDREPKLVKSNFVEIKDKPFVRTDILITPEKPDGNSGYYKTQPVVLLLPQTNTGEAVETYYHFDSQQDVIYSSPIYVPEGVHTLYYYSKSASVSEDIKSSDFKVDLTPPVINVVAPDDSLVSDTNRITFIVTVSDINKTALNVNGSAVMPNEKGEYIANFSLSEGENDFVITAQDLAGNISTEQRKVFYYSVSPTIKILSPSNFQLFSATDIVIKGVVNPVSDVKLEINGLQVNYDENGNFECPITLQTEGMNIVTVTAKHNLSGKSVSVNLVVYYKPVVVKKEIKVVLKIGSKEVIVDGESKTLDVAPYIDPATNRTLVPIRFISEVFGGNVEWDEKNKNINISLNSIQIALQVGNYNAFVNGKFIKLEQPPVIKDGRTMVPIRFISEAMGAQVSWDEESKQITIVFAIK